MSTIELFPPPPPTPPDSAEARDINRQYNELVMRVGGCAFNGLTEELPYGRASSEQAGLALTRWIVHTEVTMAGNVGLRDVSPVKQDDERYIGPLLDTSAKTFHNHWLTTRSSRVLPSLVYDVRKTLTHVPKRPKARARVIDIEKLSEGERGLLVLGQYDDQEPTQAVPQSIAMRIFDKVAKGGRDVTVVDLRLALDSLHKHYRASSVAPNPDGVFRRFARSQYGTYLVPSIHRKRALLHRQAQAAVAGFASAKYNMAFSSRQAQIVVEAELLRRTGFVPETSPEAWRINYARDARLLRVWREAGKGGRRADSNLPDATRAIINGSLARGHERNKHRVGRAFLAAIQGHTTYRLPRRQRKDN